MFAMQPVASPSQPRVGIIGAGSAARAAWLHIHRAGLTVSAVGCRDVERGNAFVAQCQREAATANLAPGASSPLRVRVACYEEVIAAPEVDVVLITIPVTLRDAVVAACVKHEKHVCLETPAAPSVELLKGWIEKLLSRQLLYCDCTGFAHSERLRKLLATGIPMVGDLRRIQVTMTENILPKDVAGTERHPLNPAVELSAALQPMGTLGGLGWFCVYAIVAAMGFTMPKTVMGRVLRRYPAGDVQGVPLAVLGELEFDGAEGGNSVIGSFYAAYDAAVNSTMVISGTKGYLTVPDFALPRVGSTPHFVYTTRKSEPGPITGRNYLLHQVIEVPSDGADRSSQEVQMWAEIARQLRHRGNRVGAAPPASTSPTDTPLSHRHCSAAWMTMCILDKVLEADGKHVTAAP